MIKHCPEILIKAITKQPSNGMVYINDDKKSVRYDTGKYTIADVGVQYFKYSVEIMPSPINQLVHEGEVTLDFRGKPMIFTPVCMAKEQDLPKTPKRYKRTSTLHMNLLYRNPLTARIFTVFGHSLLEDRALHKEAWVAKLLGTHLSIKGHKKVKFL